MELNITLWDLNNEELRKLTAPIVYLAILFIIGVPGNLIAFIIYHRKYTRCVYRTIIKSLAVVDLGFCLTIIPFNIVRVIFYLLFTELWVCKLFTSMIIFFITYSSHLLLLLSGHRFRQVCMPLKAQITTENIRCWIFGCFIVAVLWTLPHPFLQPLEEINLGQNLTGLSCPVAWENTSVQLSVYNTFLITIFVMYAILLFTTYSLIGRKVYMQQQKTQSMHSPNDDFHGKMTRIALTICATFTVSYIPLFGIKLAAKSIHENNLDVIQFSVLKIVERSYIINHVANPFIYAIFDRNFRQQFKMLLVCPCMRNDNVQTNENRYTSNENTLATLTL